MNRLDWAQIALSLVVMLAGLYIALSRHSRGGVLATTRVASVGVALLGLGYLLISAQTSKPRILAALCNRG